MSATFLIVCFFKFKEKHFSNWEKYFLFHFRSSFCCGEDQILEFYIFKLLDVTKCLSIKQEIHFTEYLGKETQSVNETWPVYVTLPKKKFHQKVLQKMWREK